MFIIFILLIWGILKINCEIIMREFVMTQEKHWPHLHYIYPKMTNQIIIRNPYYYSYDHSRPTITLIVGLNTRLHNT